MAESDVLQQPLILTLQMNQEAQAFYDGLRRTYFPPERNVIGAHLTLFHRLPDEEPTYEAVERAALATLPLVLSDATTQSIGRGVAVFFRSEALLRLHAELSAAFADCLIAQDRQRLRPHIVVQNKVAAETARDTLLRLGGVELVEARGIGLTLWRYLGGPWEQVREFPFALGEARD